MQQIFITTTDPINQFFLSMRILLLKKLLHGGISQQPRGEIHLTNTHSLKIADSKTTESSILTLSNLKSQQHDHQNHAPLERAIKSPSQKSYSETQRKSQHLIAITWRNLTSLPETAPRARPLESHGNLIKKTTLITEKISTHRSRISKILRLNIKVTFGLIQYANLLERKKENSPCTEDWRCIPKKWLRARIGFPGQDTWSKIDIWKMRQGCMKEISDLVKDWICQCQQMTIQDRYISFQVFVLDLLGLQRNYRILLLKSWGLINEGKINFLHFDSFLPLKSTFHRFI